MQISRKEFIELVGLGAASIAITACLGACKKDSVTEPTSSSNPSPPNTLLFDLDLTDSSYKSLNTNGGYIYKSGIIVAKANSGNYIAVSQACPHQGSAVQYVVAQQLFNCPNHGSQFNENGVVTQGPATASLTKYATSLTGNILSIKTL